jgi:Uma2 family endonuclease
MNAPFQHPQTMARHQFTLDDVLEMITKGLIDRRVQLLDGEIYDMPSDGAPHARFAMGIGRLFMAHLPAQKFVGVQTTLKLSDRNAPSPDIYVLNGRLPDGDVSPDQILLVVEVGDTTLKDDLADKASRYARHGVREYWVVDVNTPCLYIHRDPVNGEYPPPQKVDATTTVAARLIPEVTLRLADIA